jgi:Uma2 family endonuclease
MVKNPIGFIALEVFLQLPETKPANEYANGQILQRPAPKGRHSTIQRGLTVGIETALKPSRVARCFPELRCTFGGRSLVPDLAIFTEIRIPRDDNGEVEDAFTIAPDWTIEILSPDQSHTRVTKNILHCLDHGCHMGWLIDPAETTVLVYRVDQSLQVFDQPAQDLPMPAFASEFQLTVGELFGWLAE